MDLNIGHVFTNDATRYAYEKLSSDHSYRAILEAREAVDDGMPPSWLAGRIKKFCGYFTSDEAPYSRNADWQCIAEVLYMGVLSGRRRAEAERTADACQKLAESATEALRTVTKALERIDGSLKAMAEHKGACAAELRKEESEAA